MKKPKSEAEAPAIVPVIQRVEAAPVVSEDPNAHPMDKHIAPDEMAHITKPLICKVKLDAIRQEIREKLPEVRNLDAPVAFFCDELLRVLETLEANQDSYREKRLIEARRRAAIAQENKR